jgi:hypothetical protein
MDDAVNGGGGGHGLCEDLTPLRKDEIGCIHKKANRLGEGGTQAVRLMLF